jgi:hypothetical protein
MTNEQRAERFNAFLQKLTYQQSIIMAKLDVMALKSEIDQLERTKMTIQVQNLVEAVNASVATSTEVVTAVNALIAKVGMSEEDKAALDSAAAALTEVNTKLAEAVAAANAT